MGGLCHDRYLRDAWAQYWTEHIFGGEFIRSEWKSFTSHSILSTPSLGIGCGGVRPRRIVARVRAPLAEVLRHCRPGCPSWRRVVGRWAMSIRAASLSHGHRYRRRRVGETRHPPSTRVPRTGGTREPTFTQERYYKPGVYNWGRGNAITTPWTSTIYYDDVSSGARPKAHWYMLTHRCYSDTAPYWTPHRAAQSSGPIPMPLQCLNTSNHPI